MRFTHPKRSAAFTLLEIMVAIALLVMVIAAIYSSWNSIVKGSRVAQDAASSAQRTRITMRTLHDSLVCACMFASSPTNYSFEAESDSDFSTLSFVAHLPKSFPRSGKFGDLTVRRLEFSVEDGAESGRQLVLRQRPLIMDFDKDEREFPLVLARDVTKFLIEFIDPQSGDWVTEWTATNLLPKEVRITVGMGKLDHFSTHPQDVMVSIVAPPAVSVRPEWQSGQVGGGVGGAPNLQPGQNGQNGQNNNGQPNQPIQFQPGQIGGQPNQNGFGQGQFGQPGGFRPQPGQNIRPR